MCGIAGVLSLSDAAEPVALAALNRVRDHMQARGPDGAGSWISQDGRVGLAHRRLAIIDLSERGAQPMLAGELSITFNGEIYNYRALCNALEQNGERFASDSDTEVLLKPYMCMGTGMFMAKLDIEGAESLALRGALKHLANDQPGTAC